MLPVWLRRILNNNVLNRAPLRVAANRDITPKTRGLIAVEALDSRVLLAVTASFADGDGTLRIIGDDQDNVITVSRSIAGTILINNGSIPILGTVPTVANTT